MPAPLKHAPLAALGLAIVAFLCVQLLRGEITLETATGRAVATVIVVLVADRILVPLAGLLIGDREPSDGDAAEVAATAADGDGPRNGDDEVGRERGR
jgi:hypothetical protein